MEAPSKSKTWASEDYLETGTTSLTQNEASTLEKEDGLSEAEYEKGLKQPKKRRVDSDTRAPPNPEQNLESDEHPLKNPSQSEIRSDAANEQVPSDTAREGEKESLAATDADWLRTRTSRLLGLTENDDEPNTATEEPATLTNPHAQLTSRHSEKSGPPDAISEENHGSVEADASLGTVDANVAAIDLSGRLFVRNLSYSTGEDDLRQLFSTAGQLEEVRYWRKLFSTNILRLLPPMMNTLIGTAYASQMMLPERAF